ncbi:MAG TPA: helix-turn-helix domain-containing protein [Candidatus Thermoplasmatota archaeon]|nr:helix-turn-helix domain-containing protein [Candidatus Thermoplasmatota archaeon]
MGFELAVVSNTPLTPVNDLETVAVQFLTQIGYLPGGENPRESLPYRLFMDCFLRRPEKQWSVEELIATLETSRPTVYRHLNKLKSLDLLEETTVRTEGEAQIRKTYRLRYGNLSKAWNFVEANVKVAMENYRKTIDHLHDLAQKEVNHG